MNSQGRKTVIWIRTIIVFWECLLPHFHLRVIQSLFYFSLKIYKPHIPIPWSKVCACMDTLVLYRVHWGYPLCALNLDSGTSSFKSMLSAPCRAFFAAMAINHFRDYKPFEGERDFPNSSYWCPTVVHSFDSAHKNKPKFPSILFIFHRAPVEKNLLC